MLFRLELTVGPGNWYIFSGFIVMEEGGYVAQCLEKDISAQGKSPKEVMECLILTIREEIEKGNFDSIGETPKEKLDLYQTLAEVTQNKRAQYTILSGLN